MNKFLAALFDGKLISKASLNLMLPENKGEYGMGIDKTSFRNPVGYTHSGRINNYLAEYWYFPQEKLGIVTLVNAINVGLFQSQNALIQYAYGKEFTQPDFEQTKDLNKEQFAKIKGTYLENGGKNTITISSDGTNLIFQSSEIGQMYVPFRYKGNDTFEYEDEKVSLEFKPDERRVLLKELGSVFEFQKM